MLNIFDTYISVHYFNHIQNGVVHRYFVSRYFLYLNAVPRYISKGVSRYISPMSKYKYP